MSILSFSISDVSMILWKRFVRVVSNQRRVQMSQKYTKQFQETIVELDEAG